MSQRLLLLLLIMMMVVVGHILGAPMKAVVN